MNGFARTFIFGIAALGMLVIGALIAVLVYLTMNGDWRSVARNYLLSEDERGQLDQLASRPYEEPLMVAREPAIEETIEAITDELGRGQVRNLYNDLQRQRASLEEQMTRLEQERAELRMAQGDLVRLQSRLAEREREIREDRERTEVLQAEFVKTQADILREVKTIRDLERENNQSLADKYSTLKSGDAWAGLRKLTVEEVVVILALMDEKKASKIMAEATKDRDYPTRSVDIHRALMRLDLDGITGDHAERMGRLYSFLKPDQIVPMLEGASSEEVAAILMSMENKDKLVMGVLTKMRELNDPREVEIQRLMLGQDLARTGP